MAFVQINSLKLEVNDDVKEFLKKIIKKSDLVPPIIIKYYPGSEAGEAYASKNVIVDIGNETKSLSLFVKYSFKFQTADQSAMDILYRNEKYFYEVAFPAFKDFFKERSDENYFKHVPTYYNKSPKNVIVLENLKKQNFELFDKTKSMNDAHFSFVLKALSKFHAISFCFQDQQPERYEEIIANTEDYFSTTGRTFGFDQMMSSYIQLFLQKMEAQRARNILDGSESLESSLVDVIMNAKSSKDKHSVLTQGDCWINNIMFLYKDGDKETPVDLMLVDWQLLRPASPVFDVSYFFYTIASKENLNNYKKYLGIYHEELAKHIKLLGSDPGTLYPYSALEEEWQRFGKYGFAMAFIVLKAMLYSKEEMPDFEKMDPQLMKEYPELLFPAMKNDTEYIQRLKDIAEHMIRNDLI